MVVWRPTSGPVEAAEIPSPAERAALEQRLVRLDDTLLPASISEDGISRVGAAVAEMLGGGYASLQNVDRQAAIVAYTQSLQDLPAWAVERGCESVRHGKVDGLNPDWPPTHGRMHQISETELAPVKTEQAQIAAVLQLERPPTVDEATRERMNVAAKAWLDRSDPIAQKITEGEGGISASTEATQRTRERLLKISQDDIRREWEAAGLEPKPYSLSLHRVMHPKQDSEGEAA
jgi:hypothetical protein